MRAYAQAIVLLLSILTPLSTGQMIKFDIEVNDFDIRCSDVGSYCLMTGNHQSFNPNSVTPYDRYLVNGMSGYQFDNQFSYLKGDICISTKQDCTATCDDSCTCTHADGDCAILDTYPDARIPKESDLVLYKTSVQDPALTSLRCSDPVTVCVQLNPEGRHFRTEDRVFSDNWFWGIDLTDCESIEDGMNSTCILECDVLCGCIDNSTDTGECTMALPTASPTAAPETMAPTVNNASSGHRLPAYLAVASTAGAVFLF